MTSEERQELCALYVLGALDPSDVAVVEARVEAGDEAFIRDISTFRETSALMPRALAPVAPNPSIRDNLMARIQATRVEPQPDPTPSFAERLSTWLGHPWAWAPTAAAVIVTVGLGWLVRDDWVRIGQLEGEVQHWRGVAEKQERLLSMMTSADVKVVTLTGSQHAPTAGARILWDTESSQWTVLVYDLPPLPSDKTYQLWFLTAEAPVPSETFQSDAEGKGLVRLRFPSLQSAVAGAAISIEPKGGVPQPTGPIFVSGQF